MALGSACCEPYSDFTIGTTTARQSIEEMVSRRDLPAPLAARICTEGYDYADSGSCAVSQEGE